MGREWLQGRQYKGILYAAGYYDRAGKSYGMFAGPNPNLNKILNTEPGEDRPGKVARIVKFAPPSNEEAIPTYEWEGARWVRINVPIVRVPVGLVVIYGAVNDVRCEVETGKAIRVFIPAINRGWWVPKAALHKDSPVTSLGDTGSMIVSLYWAEEVADSWCMHGMSLSDLWKEIKEQEDVY